MVPLSQPNILVFSQLLEELALYFEEFVLVIANDDDEEFAIFILTANPIHVVH
jgi:hypothetical protein